MMQRLIVVRPEEGAKRYEATGGREEDPKIAGIEQEKPKPVVPLYPPVSLRRFARVI